MLQECAKWMCQLGLALNKTYVQCEPKIVATVLHSLELLRDCDACIMSRLYAYGVLLYRHVFLRARCHRRCSRTQPIALAAY